MKYLTVEQVIIINSSIIRKYGGLYGLRDKTVLESAIASPMATMFKKELYPSLLEKAACYLFSICKNHPFLDGNKRTATACCLIFIRNHGFEIDYKKQEFEDFVSKLAERKMVREDVILFLREKCRVQEKNS